MTYCMVMLAVEIKGLTCRGVQTGADTYWRRGRDFRSDGKEIQWA